jgi:hypothetical protein
LDKIEAIEKKAKAKTKVTSSKDNAATLSHHESSSKAPCIKAPKRRWSATESKDKAEENLMKNEEPREVKKSNENLPKKKVPIDKNEVITRSRGKFDEK